MISVGVRSSNLQRVVNKPERIEKWEKEKRTREGRGKRKERDKRERAMVSVGMT